jgi:hypothetical protein
MQGEKKDSFFCNRENFVKHSFKIFKDFSRPFTENKISKLFPVFLDGRTQASVV